MVFRFCICLIALSFAGCAPLTSQLSQEMAPQISTEVAVQVGTAVVERVATAMADRQTGQKPLDSMVVARRQSAGSRIASAIRLLAQIL